MSDALDRINSLDEFLEKAGPFIGSRGGKWADAAHTIPWKEGGAVAGRKPQGKVKAKAKGVIGKTPSGKPIHREPKADKYYADWTSVDHAKASLFFEGKESPEGHGYDMKNFHSAMMGVKMNEEHGMSSYSAKEDANKFRKRARKKIREYNKSDNPINELSKSLEAGEIETLEKSILGYGGRRTEWANQFMGTPLYLKALQLTKERLLCSREYAENSKKEYSYRELEEMPRSKRQAIRVKESAARDKIRKKEDAIGVKAADLEAALLDHQIEMEKKVGKSDNAIDDLRKSLEDSDLAKAGPKKPPKEYREEGATKRSDYADPENYKYPLHTESNVRAAISYFSKPKNAAVYSTSKQKAIWGRIRRAARKYKIELGKESGPPSVEKSCPSKREEKSCPGKPGEEELAKRKASARAAGLPSATASVTPEQARSILHTGTAHGRPLTEQQRKFFGAIGGHLPAPGKKAKKSMNSIDALEELVKGSGSTVGETTTSSPQKNLGEASSLPGDNAAGAGALPHGENKGDGGSFGPGATGRPPQPGGGAESPGGKLSEDDEDVEQQMADKPRWDQQRGGSQIMMGRYRKSDPPVGTRMTPAVQAEAQAHERAVAVSQFHKSNDIRPSEGVEPRQGQGQEVFEKAHHVRHGEMVHMSNVSDLEVERMQKSNDFYHGGEPSMDITGDLRKSKPCVGGGKHLMPAYLTTCNQCGAQAGQGFAGAGIGLMKSGQGLTRPFEPDLDLSKGLTIPDEE